MWLLPLNKLGCLWFRLKKHSDLIFIFLRVHLNSFVKMPLTLLKSHMMHQLILLFGITSHVTCKATTHILKIFSTFHCPDVPQISFASFTSQTLFKDALGRNWYTDLKRSLAGSLCECFLRNSKWSFLLIADSRYLWNCRVDLCSAMLEDLGSEGLEYLVL